MDNNNQNAINKKDKNWINHFSFSERKRIHIKQKEEKHIPKVSENIPNILIIKEDIVSPITGMFDNFEHIITTKKDESSSKSQYKKVLINVECSEDQVRFGVKPTRNSPTQSYEEFSPVEQVKHKEIKERISVYENGE